VTLSDASSQGLSSNRGGNLGDRPFPFSFLFKQVLSFSLSLGLEDGSLGDRCLPGKKGQPQRRMKIRSADVPGSAAASPESDPSS